MKDLDAVIAQLPRLNALRRAERTSAQTREWLELERLVAALGGHCRLAVYGTLAPGQCNHHLVAGFGGHWRDGSVNGHLGQRQFRVFTWRRDAPPVAVKLLTTEAPIDWTELDAFEGADYPRAVVPVSVAGAVELANLYEAAVPVGPA
jgi:gamma-glutamylcyclotransferase (GGCT)/AIG2-like uncharacterized protein YtfP